MAAAQVKAMNLNQWASTASRGAGHG